MLLAITGCRTTPPAALNRFEFEQPHMGTLFRLTLYAPDATSARTASDAAFARVAELNAMMTDYDAASELMRLCRQPVGKPVAVSDDLFAVLRQAQRLAALSDGAFDVTAGPIVRQWRRARQTGELPAAVQLARARSAVGWQKLKLDPATQTVTMLASNLHLDLGGIAKGYAADAALAVLKQRGCPAALVAASGDIAVGSPPPGTKGWRVSIGNPTAGAPAARALLLKNAAVSTSGDTEQFVEIGGVRYSHIVNPRTGLGLTNHLQVTVVARHATDSDSLATTVCVLGVERGLKLIESQRNTAALILRQREGKLEAITSKRFAAIPQPKD
jgi:thiamine biosynthesis lipoprotein